MSPELSVVMSVYNGARYLRESVESILSQTYSDFELIIVDDGSTDTTPSILRTYSDPRITHLRNTTNRGLATSLNRGLRAARGALVARQDADDISVPHRLEAQVAFAQKQPEVGLFGSPCSVIDADANVLGRYPVPTSDLQIRWTSLLTNPFAHPTVVVRHDILVRYDLIYDESLEAAQDYELWTRVLRYTRGANLEEPLLLYRRGGDITVQRRAAQLRIQDNVALRTIREHFPNFPVTSEQVRQLRKLFVGGEEYRPDLDKDRVALAKLYLDLLAAFVDRERDGQPGTNALEREATFKVAVALLRRPLQTGWARVLIRALRLNPRLPGSVVSLLASLAYGRVGSRWKQGTE